MNQFSDIKNKTFVDYLLEHSAKCPDKIAVVDVDSSITYKEIDEQSACLAHYLLQQGVKADDFVCVSLPRRKEYVISILAIMRIGAAFVPVDLSYPKERKDFILKDSGAKITITEDFLAKVDFSKKRQGINYSTPQNLTYMIYTSGSTGKPKGVVSKNKAISILIQCYLNAFDLRAEDRFLATSSFVFVATMADLICPLAAGACVHIVSEELRKDLTALYNYIVSNNINKVFTSTALGSLLINTYPDINLDYIQMAGEKMLPIKKTNTQIINMYGQTETSSCSLFHFVDQEKDVTIPIGRVVPSLRAFICNEKGELVPDGEPGELLLCGEQLCVGYWGQEELTAQKFIASPLAPGERLYKTGDRVRLNERGEMEYLGRLDSQVKIRGFRIELGEIEAVTNTYNGIVSSVANVYNSQIVLYYTAESKIEKQKLTDFLSSNLASYMVPTILIQLDAIPLNTNGKKDRSKLPIPVLSEEIIAPSSESEKRIYEIVSTLLGSTNFGVNTNLISLGLSSLSAMSFSLRLSEEFNANLKSYEILQNPTISAIAKSISQEKEKITYSTQESYPISENQKALFLEWEINPNSTKYNIPTVLTFNNVDATCLKEALIKTINAHSALKRIFTKKDGKILQLRQDAAEVKIEIFDYEPNNDYFRTLIQPFDLFNEPLYRFKIFKTANGCRLFYDIHHTIFDGLSSEVFKSDLRKAINGETLRQETFSAFENALQEKAWLQGSKYNEAADYFNTLLEGAQAFAYPKSSKPRGGSESSAILQLEIEASEVKNYCTTNAFTLNSFFITILSELLQRFSREEKLVISSINNGRNNSLQNSIGMFVQTLPVVCSSTDKDTLLNAVSTIQNQLLKSTSYQQYPYSKIVSTLGGAPDLLFVYQEGINSLSEGGTIEFASESLIQALTVMVYPKDDTKFTLQFAYDTSLYSEHDIYTLAHSYRTLIYNSIKSPHASVKDIAIVNEEEKRKLIALSKGKDLLYNCDETIISMLLGIAEQSPNSIAVVDNNSTITYGQLLSRSNDFAQYLLNLGVEPNDFVAICLPRKKEFLLISIAIMRIGAAFVPIDFDYPKDRKDHIIEDSAAKLTITEEFLQNFYNSGVKATKSINLAIPNNYAYMIYTSGSTGKPKGVVISQRALRAYVAAKTDFIEYTPDSRHLLYANFSFDASIDSIYCPLAVGASLYVAGDDIRKDMHKLNDYIIANKITSSLLTTQLAMLFVNAYPNSPIKYLTTGGEKLLPVKKTSINIINIYGPTEFTVASSFHLVDQNAEGDIPIGRPVPNSYSFICDAKGYLLPQGVVGEIVLCGRQISEGYWNRAELTKEKFVPCPFVPGQKMYHTGDLARYNHKGELEIMGRIDHQVKLRGFRIELGEIETLAAQFGGVKNAIALVVDSKIVLYYCANTTIEQEEFKTFLSKSLADFMMPSVYMQLDSMPYTSNGKIDRRKLPKPENREEKIAPKGEIESSIYSLVAELLKTDSFGVTTNLITQGLDSLSAMSISAKLYDSLGIDLPASVMMKYHTIREWAQRIKSTSVNASALEYYPLCDNQQRLYVEWELHKDSTQYNMPSVRLYNNASCSDLVKALEAFIQAHSYIKTHFTLHENSLVQLKMDDAPVVINEAKLEGENLKEFFQSRVRPFNLLEGPLYRFELYPCQSGVYLFSDFHHAIFDGLSYKLFYDALSGALQGQTLQQEKYTAFDRAVDEQKWMNSSNFKEAEAYYTKILKGAEIATFKHSAIPDSDVPGALSKKSVLLQSQKINDFCLKNGLTPNTFFLGTFVALLHRICRQDNLVFNYIHSGRDSASLYGVAGMFVKTLPVVSTDFWDNNGTFANFATKMQEDLADGLSYSNYPYSNIILHLNKQPEITFVYEGGVLDSLQETINLSLDTAKMPLSVIVTPTQTGDYNIEFEYDASLYNGQDIATLLDSYRAFIISTTLHEKLKDIRNVSPSVKDSLMALSKGENLAYPQDETFVDMVLRICAQTPDAVAVVDCNGTLTYKDLDLLSNKLALYLLEQGIRANAFVCVSLKRRKEFIISVLAIMRIGAGYVPIDLEYPTDRQEFMKSDAESKLLIDETLLSKVLTSTAAPSQSINYSSPSTKAYMIYTSGSTGKPKGVIVSQAALRAMLAWSITLFKSSSQSRHLSHISFSFDASIIDLYTPLAVGGTTYLLPEELRTNMEAMYNYIIDNAITVASFSTQIGSLFINTYPTVPLRYICIGGEKMLPLKKTDVTILNAYGPTEFTVASSYHIVNQDTDVDIPIGRPAPNSYSFICDNYGQLLPQGFAGELCLMGKQIADGYWMRPRSTEEAFVDCPFMRGQKMYRTGDICYYNKEGQLMYLGRKDNMVKLRGYRIELSEIENIASIFYGIDSVAAAVKEVAEGTPELCLYYTSIIEIDKQKLKHFLAEKLPAYMVPSYFVQLESMPLSPNGKINTKALPKVQFSSKKVGRFPRTEKERLFVNIFKSILGLNVIYADDNFFEIGGTSLNAIRIVIAAEEQGLKLTYSDVFSCKTAEKLAALFESTQQASTEFEDISLYDYTAINSLLRNNTLGNFLSGRKQSFKTVLLLGATGFLGIHIFHKLLVSYPNTHIVCLVRSDGRQRGEDRLKSVYNYYFGALPFDFTEGGITVIEGDISIGSDFTELLKQQIDLVINSAANVNHFSQGDDIYKVNYEGVLNIIDFCKQSKARLVHISTTSVSGVFMGHQTKDMHYRENTLFVGQSQLSKYTLSKYLAERAILQSVANGDISAKIMRVGNLSPRIKDGKFQMNASSNAFMSRVKSSVIIGAHFIGEEYMDLEFSPIDLVAQAILLLANTPKENVVFHPFNNNMEIMGTLYDCMNEAKLYTKAVNYQEYSARLNEVKKDPELASILLGLLAYDFKNKEEIVPLQVPANFTQRVLNYLGFHWPLLQKEYIKQFLAELSDMGFFKVSGKA